MSQATPAQHMRSLRGHLRRTRIIAWACIVTLAVLIGLLIHGGGRLAMVADHDPQAIWPTSEPFHLRSAILAKRDAALDAQDLASAAQLNGLLAHEARMRASALMHAWLKRQHPRTRLFAQSARVSEWNYRNTAADFFSHLLNAAMSLDDQPSLAALRQTLDAEAAITPPGELCQPVRYDTAEPIRQPHEELMFASSEYVKDGLLSVFERHGDDQVLQRMRQIIGAIIRQSSVASRFGMLPSTRSETNGNMLQVCSRLSYRADADPAWADLAARLADAAIDQMLKANHSLPAHYYDYARDRVIQSECRLRDHGNELPVGLSEAYALAVHRAESDPRWLERADRWAPPLADMFQIILEHGFRDDGLMGSAIDPRTRTLLDTDVNDNWGYLFAGVLLYVDAARRHGVVDSARLDAMVQRIRIAVLQIAGTDGLAWQGRNVDGYYDALESALLMAAHFPDDDVRQAMARWTDDQIGIMYRAQHSSGIVDAHYLDGNFIRTALMYAMCRSGGWRLLPHSPHARVGIASDRHGRHVLAIAADRPYRGRLVPDQPRHRLLLSLPDDLPRLNSWPQWMTPDQIDRAEVHMIGSTQLIDPAALAHDGIDVDLPAHGRMVVHLHARGARAVGTGHAPRHDRTASAAPLTQSSRSP